MNSVGFSDLPNPLHPLPGGTNGLPAGRQKPPCRFAPEVLMNSVGFSDLPNPLHPLPGGTNGLPAGRQKPPCRFAPEVLMSGSARTSRHVRRAAIFIKASHWSGDGFPVFATP